MIDSFSILLHNGRLVREDQSVQLPPEGFFASCQISEQHHTVNYYIIISARTQLAKPLQIINRFDDQISAMQIRLQLVLEAGSSAQLLITDQTVSSDACICNYVMDITLCEGVNLELVHLQKINGDARLHTDTNVEQSAASRMKTHFILLGGGAVHNSLKATLTGKNAEHIATGLSLTQQSEQAENQIRITHASPECRSSQLFKNILYDRSKGVFTGHIIVNKDAQKTVAFQCNKNILLHPTAKVNLQPHLEIYANDVKCSHGATVGQLDAEALFYLRSRGISKDEAKKLLLRAFADEVLNAITCEAIRKNVLHLAEEKIINSIHKTDENKYL